MDRSAKIIDAVGIRDFFDIYWVEGQQLDVLWNKICSGSDEFVDGMQLIEVAQVRKSDDEVTKLIIELVT